MPTPHEPLAQALIPTAGSGLARAACGASICLIAATSLLTVAKSLNDASLVLDTGEIIMEFRLLRSSFNPIPTTGISAPTVFCRMFTFEYMFQGSI